MKRISVSHHAIITIIVVLSIIGCKKEEVPVITTTAVSNITATTATSGGNITDEGSSTVITRGICWSTGTTPTIADKKTTDGAGAGSFSSNIVDLFGGTTYFVRAYATNSTGIGYGMALSLKTAGDPPSPPTAIIGNATNLQTNSATLNGTVNAKYYSTTVTFEYGTTTSFGGSTAATQSPVTGSENTSVSVNITGLTEGTKYYYRIKAVNQLGIIYSDALTFTTFGQAPIATTQTATNISTVAAQLNGTVNANYLSTTVTFEWGTTTSYGNSVTATQSPVTGGANTNISANITGLSPKTIYYFQVKTVNSLGTTYGNSLTFTTLGQVPTAITQVATSITITSAQLNGTVNANYLSSVVTIEWGTTTSYGNTSATNESPVTGNTSTTVSANISGLSIATTYHYRVKAENSLGINYGSDMTFITLGQVPTVTIMAATNITTTSAQLNCTVNANYLSSVVTFEWGTTISYGNTSTAIQSPVTGGANTNINANITGLTEGTTYHYRVKAENLLGISISEDMTFRTLGQVPTVIIQAATNILSVSAQLNGTVNANYLSSVVTFEWGITTSYGNDVTPTQSPATGSTVKNISSTISGLTVETTYHYRIKAVNSLGTSYSGDMTFKTAYIIGEYTNGGIVFYIDGTKLHGFVCAPSDQTQNLPLLGIQWYNGSNVDVSGTNINWGYGQANTTAIINAQGVGSYAAQLCNDLSLNGYDDWFLPSRGELDLMYQNRVSIESTALLIGGTAFSDTNPTYWSSSQYYDYQKAWSQILGNVANGLQEGTFKWGALSVRAVRAF